MTKVNLAPFMNMTDIIAGKDDSYFLMAYRQMNLALHYFFVGIACEHLE
jgi:hypothetical protein